MKEGLTGIILAGGRSRRFGSKKTLALLQGIPLIEWVRRGLEPLCKRVVVVTAPGREHPEIDLEVWEDLEEGKGVLGGIATGLEKAETPLVFAAGCDVPFLKPALVEMLMAETEGADLVVPKTERGYEPLRAIYGKGCLPVMKKRMGEGELKVDGFFREVRTREIPEAALRRSDPDLISFVNINIREDLSRAEALIREGKVTPPTPG